MYKPLKQLHVTEPPWSTRYPALARILDEQPQAPRGNVVARNVFCRCSWRQPDRRYVRLEDNYLTEEDPGFVHAANMNFELRDDSIVYQKIPGFKRIDFAQIGPHEDGHRASCPPCDGPP